MLGLGGGARIERSRWEGNEISRSSSPSFGGKDGLTSVAGHVLTGNISRRRFALGEPSKELGDKDPESYWRLENGIACRRDG